MSDINKTGVNKKLNIFDDLTIRVCQVIGLKENSYLVGLEKLVNHLRQNIILIGMKACGKSTVGKLLAQKMKIDFIELDEEIEKTNFIWKKERLTFREIFKKQGADFFRSLENRVLNNIGQKSGKFFVLSCGGGTPLNINNQKLLKRLGKIIFLNADEETLLPRILKHGIPAFFPFPDDPEKSLKNLLKKRRPIYEKIADQIISFKNESPEELVEKII
jgi:shikimate kinase